ncbi:MAG: glycine betaine ABC transporter substrate-binding protein [Rhodothermia bacterium]
MVAMGQTDPDRVLVVGSKKFTENVILGELVKSSIQSNGISCEHRAEVGGTRILWEALKRGEIDAYVDYTGTIRLEILAGESVESDDDLAEALERHGVSMSRPLGFNNTYALGMRRDRAGELGIRSISNLIGHPELVLGFSNEFMDREDGWPGLRRAYGLKNGDVRGLDHDLAYRGVKDGALDVLDVYTTDAEIEYYDLVALQDDRGHFPSYEAVVLYRSELEDSAPRAVEAIERLAGLISERRMVAMNAAARIDGTPEAIVARNFLAEMLQIEVPVEQESRFDRMTARTGEHLILVLISLVFAILVAVPLGVAAFRSPRSGSVILAFVGVIYTIPSLALLVFMIPLFGIGAGPAMVALFLYSLLPIVRNTHAGLVEIPASVRESAIALGLSEWFRLRRIDLPMASGTILAGIKTAAVINIGTATLGALIGAGGYGQPILTGIRLDDVGLILEGAVPAAILAVLAQLLFGMAGRIVIPRGLRI